MVIEIKNIANEDIKNIVECENNTWEEGMRYSAEDFKDMIKRYPSSFFGVYVGDKLSGMYYAQPIKELKKTWEENNSEKSFDPNSKMLYVTNIGVRKDVQKSGLGSELLKAGKEFAVKNGFETIYLGSRLISTGFFAKSGFEIYEEVEDFWPVDEESEGVGVLMKWDVKKS